MGQYFKNRLKLYGCCVLYMNFGEMLGLDSLIKAKRLLLIVAQGKHQLYVIADR